MRTSLNKLQDIEFFVSRQTPPAEALVFEARMIVDQDLATEVSLQKEAYSLINQYGRRQLKTQLDAVHQQLFTLPKHVRFRQKIMALFK